MTTSVQPQVNLLSADDAEHLMSYIERLTGKSKLEDIRFALWEMSQGRVCRSNYEIETKIRLLMSDATSSRKQATKQAAIEATIAYIKSIAPATPATSNEPAPLETVEAPVVAETPAPAAETSEYKVGDTVIFKYFLDPLVGQEEFEGTITDAKQDRLCGMMYYVIPTEAQTKRFNLYPRWLAARYIKQVVTPIVETGDLYQTMKNTEAVFNAYARLDTFDLAADHATYRRKVAAHIRYLRAQAAYIGTSNEGLIAYLYGKSYAETPAAPITVKTPLFSSDAVLSDRDRARIDRHVKAAGEQFGKEPLPTPEKKDWRDEYPSLIAVQQHRLNQSRKNA